MVCLFLQWQLVAVFILLFLTLWIFGAATGKRGVALPVAESLGLIVLLKGTFGALEAHPLHLPPPNFGRPPKLQNLTCLHTHLGAGGGEVKVFQSLLELSITWSMWAHLPAR